MFDGEKISISGDIPGFFSGSKDDCPMKNPSTAAPPPAAEESEPRGVT